VCGLTGFLELRRRRDAGELERIAGRMADTLQARGPDDAGTFVDADCGYAVGFRRLAIRDLSPAGHQPMASADGRLVIAYNGEVYNAAEIGAELEGRGVRFRGHSDTEVIVEACAAWGVEQTLRRLIGMFAIALWDRASRSLSLARDRLGIKPLYLGRVDETIFFGSQPRSFFPHPDWRAEIEPRSLASYLRWNHVPAPLSIFRGMGQLAPGTWARVQADGRIHRERYWSAEEAAARGQAEPLELSDAEAVEQLDALLRDAVQRRMLADVPLGAFLSGGIDSSTVVALMQAQSAHPVRTFSIGYHEDAHSEARFAKAVAQHLGTEHHELYVEPGHALGVVSRLPEWYDEPFADSSQIPTFLVSELARSGVTVSLSGDGGDELFAGYPRYAFARDMLRRVSRVPAPLRTPLATLVEGIPARVWTAASRLVPRRYRPAHLGVRLHAEAARLRAGGEERVYLGLLSHWDPAELCPDVPEPDDGWREGQLARCAPDFARRMQLVDQLGYLPNDILTKVDRASMAVSLEVRVPLLDHRVVEFAWRLPYHQLVRDGREKWLLRQVLARYVPTELVDRPKMGFGVPIADWLRGPLRDWAEALLDERSLRADGLLDPTPIRARWREHLDGVGDWQYPLWVILMFQLWKQRWIGA
jgi:asparagine synthase (glutamine-hydrolysing)